MANEIKELDIKISADARNASRSIDNLIGKLRGLSASLNNINGNGLKSFSQGVNQLASSMQQMNNVKTADVTRLTKNLSKISNINTVSITGVAKTIDDLSRSMNSLTNVNMAGSSSQIAELASGISKLGYKSATQAIQNIPYLSNAMLDLMNNMAKAPAINRSVIDFTNALARLAKTGTSAGRSATALSKSMNSVGASANRSSGSTYRLRSAINSLIPSLNKANSKTFSLAAAFGKLYASYWLVFRGIKKLGEAVTVASDLAEVQNVVDVTFGDFNNKIEELASTAITQLGMSELAVKKFAGRFQAMGTALGFSTEKMSDVSVNLTRLTSDLSSFYNVEQETAALALQSIFTGETEPLRKYGLDISQATIQQWALNNGINANVNSMTYMEKAMLRYQYVMANTENVQGDFIRTQNNWANQIRILKNNFQALGTTIGQVIIQFLKPFVQALNIVMVQINKFAKMVSEALGTIFGWTYDTGGGVTEDVDMAAGGAEDLADNLGTATDNAKKLKQQLQGFDELNVLSTTDDKSKNGGVGSAIGDLSNIDYGGWKKTEEGLVASFNSTIKDLYSLGATISETLANAMDGIDWDSVYGKAKDFGKNLAAYMNGRFASAEGKHYFDSLGTTIGGAINTALIAIDTFATEFEWTNFGKNLASGANSFFKTFQFSTLAKTIADSLNGVVQTAFGFVTEFDWKELGTNIANGINTFFRTFEFGDLAITISKGIKGVLTTVSTMFAETDFAEIGRKVGEFLANLEWVSILAKCGQVIAQAIGAAIEAGWNMFKTAPIETLLVGSLSVLTLTGLGATLAEKIGTEIAKGVATKLSVEWAEGMGVGAVLKTGILQSITVEGVGISVGQLLTTDIGAIAVNGSLMAKAATIGTAIAGSIVAAVVGFEIGKKIGEKAFEWSGDEVGAQAFKDFKWSDFFDACNISDAKGAFKAWKEDLGTVDEFWDGLALDIIPNWKLTKDTVKGWQEQLSGWWADFKLGFSVGWNVGSDFVKNKIAEIKSAWGNFFLEIGLKLKSFSPSQWWSEIKANWNGSNEKNEGLEVNAKATGGDKTSKGIWSGVKSAWDKYTKNKKLKVKAEGSNPSGTAKNFLNSIQNTFNTNPVKANLEINQKSLNDLAKTSVKIQTEFQSGKTTITVKDQNGNDKTISAHALGGIFKNGFWKSIPQYAAGGFPSRSHGSLFVAGEAGPEIVGHVGGQTEVLNQSQLAATMYSAVVRAMSDANNPVQVYLDGKVVFDNTRQRANEYFAKTGNSAFAY